MRLEHLLSGDADDLLKMVSGALPFSLSSFFYVSTRAKKSVWNPYDIRELEVTLLRAQHLARDYGTGD